jgi:hypothetical protein
MNFLRNRLGCWETGEAGKPDTNRAQYRKVLPCGKEDFAERSCGKAKSVRGQPFANLMKS